jgi:hypothetical protein
MTVVNQQLNSAEQTKRGYKFVKYSFIIKNSDFKPSDNYTYTHKNDKIYVNLYKIAERTAFFNDLQKYNEQNPTNTVKAREALYEYFVYSKYDDKEISFNNIVKHIKDICMNDDKIKNLINCFKVVNDKKNYKVVVSSHDLAVILNKDKLFYPYKKNSSKIINVSTTIVENEVTI